MDRRTRQKFQRITVRRSDTEIYGFVGNFHTGEVFVDIKNTTVIYVTIAFNGQVMKVRNLRFPATWKYPVRIGYQPGSHVLEVVGEWQGIYPDMNLPQLPHHPHTWGDTDNPAWIRNENILNLLPSKKTGMIVQVNSGSYMINGERFGFLYREFDMSSYIPASGARWVSVVIDDTGAISYIEGSSYASRALLDISNIPSETNTQYLLFAVKTYLSQDEVRFTPRDNDIYDPRLTWRSGRSFELLWNDLQGIPNLEVPVRGSYRWIGDGVETEFMLADYLEELDQVFDNSLLVDPFVVNLSDDGGSVIFDDAPTDGHVIMAYGILRSL